MRNYIIISLLLLAACRKTSTFNALGSTIGVSPDVGLAGTIVSITGKGFGTDTGAVHVSFNGTSAMVQSATDTLMLVTVPSGTTGPVTVSKGGQQVKGPVYTFQNLSITAISPTGGQSGIADTISGMGFNYSGVEQSVLPAVFFNGKPGKVIGADSNRIIVIVPDTAGVGPVSVELGSLKVTGPVFNYVGVVSVAPQTGNVGTMVTISGGFGPAYASATVTIGGKQAAVTSSSAVQIVCMVSAGDTTGPVLVHLSNGQALAGPVFTFVPPPTISTMVPNSGPAGTKVTITGANFSTVLTENKVTVNGTAATVVSSNGNQLVFISPNGTTDGPVVVMVNGQTVTGPNYKYQNLGIKSINPANAIPPCVATISGFAFGTNAGSVIVQINGINCAISSIVDTQLVVSVPSGVTTGPVTVQIGGLTAGGPVFSTAGVATFAGGIAGLNDGVGTNAQFVYPAGLAFDASGNLYVADAGANNIRKIAPNGTVTNFAGDPGGNTGFLDESGASALFNRPQGLAIDKSGNLYVADNNNGAIRKITPSGVVSTFNSGTVSEPYGIAVDASGNVYVSDYSTSNNVYQFDASGNLVNTINYPNCDPRCSKEFQTVVVDNMGNFYVIEYRGDGIYKNGSQWFPGEPNFSSEDYPPQGNKGICLTPSGNLIVADGGNNVIDSLTLQPQNLTKITGGSGSNTAGFQDGTLPSALFSNPSFVIVDAQGNIYVSDQGNNAIRKISLH